MPPAVDRPPRDDERPVEILVLAGPNGAGKSSVGGAALRGFGGTYFNPDEFAQVLRAADPALTQHDANARAWAKGRAGLQRAIDEGLSFAIETTLGGRTIAQMLLDATAAGIRVRIWFVALATADLHVERVRRRVEAGGHPIPEPDVRRRYDTSRLNLIDLLTCVAEVRVFDNTADAGAAAPAPVEVLHVVNGAMRSCLPLTKVPTWAKPIVAAALA